MGEETLRPEIIHAKEKDLVCKTTSKTVKVICVQRK
jgi:hypothetical protein